MPQIKHLTVRNYRSLAEVSLTLPRLSVLVGSNGSGKSNFIDVLRFVSEAMQLGLDTAITKRGGIGRIRRWSSKGRPYDVSVDLVLDLDEHEARYTFTLGSEKRNEYGIKHEKFEFNGTVVFERKKDTWEVQPEEVRLQIQPRTLSMVLLAETPAIQSAYRFLTDMGFYTIFPDALREPQPATLPHPLDEHGKNLASLLRDARHETTWHERLERYLQAIVPSVEGLRVQSVGSHLVVKVKHTDSGEFDLAQESDGTLRVLGVLTALLQQPPRTFIALEEPELTIHPRALRALCDVIDEAATRSQIIITSHSPDIIAYFDVSKLLVVERGLEGTKIGPLDWQQARTIEDEFFTTSDLLRIEGLQQESSS